MVVIPKAVVIATIRGFLWSSVASKSFFDNLAIISYMDSTWALHSSCLMGVCLPAPKARRRHLFCITHIFFMCLFAALPQQGAPYVNIGRMTFLYSITLLSREVFLFCNINCSLRNAARALQILLAIASRKVSLLSSETPRYFTQCTAGGVAFRNLG